MPLDRVGSAASTTGGRAGFWRGGPGPEAGCLTEAELDDLEITTRELARPGAGDFEVVYVEPDGTVLGWWERVLVPYGGRRPSAPSPATRYGREPR